jgi:tetratricopeptide (TPR) repeat protein
MSKVLLFSALWWITGNPFIAIVILLVILYWLDRRFIGLTPSIARPIKRRQRLNQLNRDIKLQPHLTSAKLELARIFLEKKRYAEALPLLEDVQRVMEDSPDVLYEIGLCRLKAGQTEEGERLIIQALEKNPRVKYGEPYLRLGETFAERDPDKAVKYLEQFHDVHSSSCEAYYLLGKLYKRMGRTEEARSAFKETLDIYRALPKYKRKSERRWALLAALSRV